MFLRIFAIISFYSALLILLVVFFVKIVQVATVLGAIEIFYFIWPHARSVLNLINFLNFFMLLDFCQILWYDTNEMEKRTEEWLRQSDYDMDTALYMYEGGRYIYAVFMCHLAVEKTLKGLYYEKRREIPPKSHNLIYLLNEIGIKPPREPGKFIVKLNEASIPTRYPESLANLQEIYSRVVVKDILSKGRELVTWIKQQL